jgi:predicted transcriptional regulator
VGSDWAFLTKHALVLSYVARNPDATIRQISDAVDVTERSVHRLVDDLVEDEYLVRVREGRRNRYHVHGSQTLRHPLHDEVQVGDLLNVLRAGSTD